MKTLCHVTIAKALPQVTSFDEAVKIYHQWSTPEEIQTYGFLGIFGIFVRPIHLKN